MDIVKLYVIPENVYRRLTAVGRQYLSTVPKAQELSDIISLNDLRDITLAAQRFQKAYTVDDLNGVVLGATPLESLLDEGESELTDRLIAAVETALGDVTAQEDVYYELHPIEGDNWVVVEQRVHTNDHHPLSVTSNRDFFDSLFRVVSAYQPIHVIAKSSLFNNYLKAVSSAQV